MLAVVFVGLLAIGLHDTVVQFGALEGEPRYWNALAAPVFILGFATVLGVRFVRAFQQAERLNEELDARVRAREGELAENFERLRHLEGDRARHDERERMMREVHDGLGGRLVETLSSVESGEVPGDEIAEQIRGALDEMRLLIDSLDPEIDDLAALLAAARERLEPGLRRRSVALAWDIGGLGDEALRLGPARALHVLRIVQEAFTNVLKHAHASRVNLSASKSGGEIRLCIEDDDVGPAAEAARAGRGVRNMESRAAALGGRLLREAGAGGTSIELRFPL